MCRSASLSASRNINILKEGLPYESVGDDHLIVRIAVTICAGPSFIYGCKEKRAL
ncbi:hypothetical protein BPJM79_40243 [Bacillus pumilus]